MTQILDFGNVPLDTAIGALGGYVGSRTVKFILGGQVRWFNPITKTVSGGANTLPTYADETLQFLKGNNFTVSKQGYSGGRIYKNDTVKFPLGQKLPDSTSTQQPIIYKEWDVSPNIQGVSRSSERIVSGSNGSIYYTNDHYITFIKLQ